MQWPMVMAIMNRSRHTPISMPSSQDDAQILIRNFLTFSVSNSDIQLCVIQAQSAQLDQQIIVILEVELSRSVSLWRFHWSLPFCLLLSVFGSRLSTHSISPCFYHLWRSIKWRSSFSVYWYHLITTWQYWLVVEVMSLHSYIYSMYNWFYPNLPTGVRVDTAQVVYIYRGGDCNVATVRNMFSVGQYPLYVISSLQAFPF